MAFTSGSRVRLKGDPAVAGVVTAAPATTIGGREFVEIEMPLGRKLYPVNQLEASDTPPDALRDFADGKLSAPSDVRRALTDQRLTGRLADMIYSIGATNTEFHAYQFKPILKILNAPSHGLLIADEVGLGKTIEAGLVWTELVARFDFRRLLVVCPKPLVEKWRDELRTKFMVDARPCDATALLDTLRIDAETREGFAMIASLPALRPPRGWDAPRNPAQGARADLARYLAEHADGDAIDLVIFDEAHHLRNVETMNHRLGLLATAAADHKLLLSATPINLRANDLRALLKLIDTDTFEREWLFDILQAENVPLVAAWEAARNPNVPLAQLASMVSNLADGVVLKTGQRLERLRNELDANPEDTPATRVRLAARLEEMSLLGSIVNRTRRRDVAEFKVERRPQTARWEMTASEREFYDAATARIADYALERDLNERFLLAGSQRLLASSLPAAYLHWGERSGSLSLDEDDDDGRPQPVPGPLVAALGEICDDPAYLAALERADTKVDGLLTLLQDIARREPSEKLIIFSSFRRTIAYLARRLTAAGVRTVQLHGGIVDDRQTTIAAFSDAPAGTVLLTSEVGGEGLDLQFCRILINYDLPWNPMKVEQRIGRIDRIGQASPVIDIVNLIAADTIEEQVYERLYLRLGIIKQTLGDFEPILGEMIRDIELVLADPKLSRAEQERELDRAAKAAEERKRQSEELEREAPGLIAHGDNILQRVHDAHAPHKTVSPDDLRDYIAGTLTAAFDGSRFEAVGGGSPAFDVRLSARAQAEFARFREASARRYPTRFTRDAAAGVRVVFGSNPDPARYRALEAVPMTHPLTRFAASMRSGRSFGLVQRPASAFEVPAGPAIPLAPGHFAIAVERWSIDAVVPIDRLVFGGVRLSDGMLLPDDTAERAMIAALALDPRLLPVLHDQIAAALGLLNSVVLPALEVQRRDFQDAEAARHYDLVETQKALLVEHRNRRRRDAEERIREYRSRPEGRGMNIAYAEQGKLEKFLARIDLRMADLKMREQNFSISAPVCVAVIFLSVRGGSDERE